MNSNINKNDFKCNFIDCVKNSSDIFPINFNEISPISVKKYCGILKKSWIDIVKEYGYYADFYSEICNRYSDFVKEKNKFGINEWMKYDKTISSAIINSIGFNKIKSSCNIKSLRYSDDDYKNNMMDIKNRLSRVPLFHEFLSLSNISIESYRNRYKLKGKKNYDTLIKMYFSEDEFKEYRHLRLEHKSAVGKITGSKSKIHSDSDLKKNFIKVFDDFKSQYGIFPSRRLFSQFSKIDDRTYRKRMQSSWSQICKFYGYHIPQKNIEEIVVLNLVSSVLQSTYEPQKTWDWLIGVGGKHMYCDGFFPLLNLVVEYDGRQHRTPVASFGGIKSFERLKENDKLKEDLLKQHGIKIVRIDSRDKWLDETYIKEKFKGILENAS